MQSEQQQRIMGYFIEEAKDHLGTIEKGLLNLQSTMADAEMIGEVFRAAHSVKGGAAMLGLDSIQKTSHRLEDYFKVLKECPVQVDQKLETLLLRVFDTLQDLLGHLQGPFGLTDEKSDEVMAEVEPVFGQLNAHLSTLVTHSGGDKPVDVDLSPHSAVTARPAIDEAAALKRFFQKDVAAELRNLLGLFKQADTTESRQQLQDICRALDQQGEAVGASQAWGELLDTSKRAIAHPDNSYRQLAPVIIKTLKQAQTLGAANRCPDIEVSEALLKLCPAVVEEAIAPTRSVDAMETEDLNDLGYGHSDVVSDAFGLDSGEFFSDSSADQPNDQPNDSFGDSSFGDSSFGDSFDNLDNNNDNIDDSDVASLFGDSFADSADADDEVDLADSLDLIDTLDVAEETSPGADPSDTNTNVDNLLDALDAQGDSAHHQRVGPQVGPEAMDSLADLFDSESSQNLSFDWSEENTGVAEPDELSDDLALDALNDFSDLLDDDTLGSSADFSTSEDDISAILNTFDHDEMPLAEPSQTDVGMDMGETATADDPLGLATDIEAEGLDNLFDQAPLASDNLLAEDSSSGLFEDTASATDALDGETDTNQTTDELLVTPAEEGDRSFDSEIDASELDNLGAFFAGQEEADFGDVDSPLDTGSPAPELLPDEFDGLFADMAEVEGLEPEQTLAGMDFNDNIGSGADREINSDANRRADDDIWGEPTSTTLGTEDMGEDIDLSDPWADSIATDGQPEPLGSETSPQAIALDLTTGPESDAVDDLFGTDDPTSQNSNTDLEIDDDTLNDASLFDDDTLNDASLFDDDFDTPADPFAELDTPLGDNPFEDSPFEDNALDSSMAMPAIASNQAVTATESLEPDFDFGQDTSLSSEATNRVDNLDGSLASDGNTNDSDILDSLFGAPAMVSAGDQSEDQIFENPGEEGLADSFEDSLTERPTFEDEADFWLDQEAEASRDELSGDEPSTTAEGSGESDDLGFDLGLDLGLTADPFTEQSNELLSESVSPDLASPDLASPDLASPDLASSEQAGVDQEDAFGFLDDLADDNAGDALDLEGMEDMEGLGFDDEAIASPSTAPTSADPTETPFDIDLDLAEATDLPDNLVGDLADNLAEHPITDSFDLDNDDNIWADESSSTGQDDFDLAVQSSPSSDDVLSAEDDLGLNLDETEFSADAGLSADVVPSANNNDDLGLGLDEVDHSTDAVLSLEDDLGLGLDESDFSADAALSPDVVLSADDDLSLGLDESDFNAEAVLSLEDDLGLGLNESDFSPDAALSPDEDLGLDLNETDLKTEDVPNPEDALGFGLDEVDSSIDAALSPDDLGLASEDALGFGLDEVDSSIDAALSPDGDISTDNDLGLGLGESDFSLDPALGAEDDLGLGLDESNFSLDGSPSPDVALSAGDDLGLGLDEADFSLDGSPSPDAVLSAEDDLGLGLDEADFSLDGSPSPDAALSAEDELGFGDDLGLGSDESDLSADASSMTHDDLGLSSNEAEADLGFGLDESDLSADAVLSSDAVLSAEDELGFGDDLELGLDESDLSAEVSSMTHDDLGLSSNEAEADLGFGLDESDLSADAVLSSDAVLSAEADLGLGLDESDLSAEVSSITDDSLGLGASEVEDDFGFGLDESDFSADTALSPDNALSDTAALGLDGADFGLSPDETDGEVTTEGDAAGLEGVLDSMFDDPTEDHAPIIMDTDNPPPGISGFGDSLDEVFADDDFNLLHDETPLAQTQVGDPQIPLDPLDDGDLAEDWAVASSGDGGEVEDIAALSVPSPSADDDNLNDFLTSNTDDFLDAADTDHLEHLGTEDLDFFDTDGEPDIAGDDGDDAWAIAQAVTDAVTEMADGTIDETVSSAVNLDSDLTDSDLAIDGLTDSDLAIDDLPDESGLTDTMADDDFADLDALLDDAPGDEIGSTFAEEDEADDFADLDALLSDSEELEASAAVTSAALATAAALDSKGGGEDDDFADLEKLLEDADQSMGGPPTSKIDVRQSPAPTRRPSPRGISNQTMRVSVKNLDDLNNMVGELVVNRNSLEQSQERLRQFLDNLLYQVHQLSDVGQRMRDLYERSLLESSLLSSRRNYQQQAISSNATGIDTFHATGASFDALEMDRFTGFHTLSQEMIELIVRVRESASDIDFVVDETDQVTRMFRQVTTQLQEGLTRTRMVPFAQAADRLPRAVRDISIKCGKQAQLEIEGRDTLIDKMILEQLYDPMTHLVNNAITHGIETPEDRVEQDKNPVGTITIRTFHQGNQTIIAVSDDGGGIDPEVVTRKAIAKGLITAQEAETMSRLDVYDLLFHHGFSTRDKADDFAGRGVGMDVVRTSLSEIRGVISIDSNIGQGTTFTIRLPLTLSISKALLCISNHASIAFPMDGVEDMLDIPKDRVQVNDQDQSCILWRDILLPFRPLSDLLKFNRSLGRRSVYGGGPEDDVISVIVLRSAGNYLALQVDQVIGEQEIVIKQLESPVPKPAGIAGATVLGDGRIMPIADVLELIDLSMGRIRRESGNTLWEQDDSVNVPDMTTAATEPTVLIVDDSITVRELLSMTFNKVGYRVEQARDGQEAWEKLRSGLPCDLVFCDIEMPRMDGLELLSRMQKDSNFSHLPIAMLTSRGADRHRQMAVQLGAKGYFTKPYLEEALLDAANRMLKGEVLVGAES